MDDPKTTWLKDEQVNKFIPVNVSLLYAAFIVLETAIAVYAVWWLSMD